eukprot:CAMPEP_0113417200 /NCGR_PEP_ID=MMETSP0013_2-20120614/25524_1 /TAXON_ID=2843 ORGANISM="Skeletonema costatum, Strain 1716" /NCGR_SAMPLE_ID=MMETSP0013_2 /ASSEMBLY_ACC=CAM_ASM_000158 /LENGTH=297 /DNA_ID=CAMNT_0000304309 /DNA_START=16 /DNA_END=909 /DNA_ORIENTATION=- /assembly_acc=CAM_ASM_000158
MRTKSLEILAALPFALAFSPTAVRRSSPCSIIRHNLADVSVISNIHGRSASLTVSMASDDEAASSQSSAPKKKRKRKDGQNFSPPPASDVTDDSSVEEAADEVIAAAAEPEEPKKTSVVMKVRDIRDIVSGAPEPAQVEEEEEVYVDDDKEDDELGDDEEWEYYDVDEDGNEIIVSNDDKTSDRTGDDSLEQLLADARSMRASTDRDAQPTEEGTPIKDKIFDVISTIVTIDFFVVIGLLAWFLLGIFCSSVLKDDTVQILFNNNFERVTQPALGILMIGSVAGSFGNKDEEEESYL